METAITFVTLVAITGGITEVIKKAIKKFPKRLVPAVAFFVGYAVGYIGGVEPLVCFIIGLTASGTYDLGKKAILGK